MPVEGRARVPMTPCETGGLAEVEALTPGRAGLHRCAIRAT
jgi:hypothetical protein